MSVTRRTFIGTGISAGLSCSLAAKSGGEPAARRPNIVFIMADDMGFADISCNSRNGISTPNIDRIAKAGVNLREAYSNSPVCSASRLAVITGRYQYRLPLGLEEPLVPARRGIGLPPDHPTLPSLLKASGYRTMLVGKWHLGEYPEFGPLKSGYEHFFGFRGGAIDYFNYTQPGQGGMIEDGVPIEKNGYLTQVLGEHAVSAIDEYAAAAAPFFMSVHFNAPHWPWMGPDDEAEANRLGKAMREAEGYKRQAIAHHFDGGSRKVYEQMITAMDDQVGKIIDALERHDVFENTIVIFTSDNGGERFSDVWPFSGQKSELLEGGLRVPALVSWPDVLPRGAVSHQVQMGMDWMPTLLAAAGVSSDPDYAPDGMNLLPVMVGDTRPVDRKVYFRYKANHQRAMRDGDYKYLKIAGHTYLFNVAEDPLERADLKEREPEVFARLEAGWKDWNSTMLPQIDESYTDSVLAKNQADHIGAEETLTTADPGN
ncbi:MAG: sulfatase-like hydrolase/transferase [Sphingomonadaceae bacterium]|nr:sulfatase-like hydrolase/transferase [Sphingomonadaceae bacterium]MCP5390860.1 sulfatase-like hydrolase/transferase [Sphingomonadaceae bacterium]MCP5394616.1 sulfatase-like hydrolase/transferase [Sphingomonadaceae bacterium]